MRKQVGYIERDKIKKNIAWVDIHKVFITKVYCGSSLIPNQVINKPLYGEPNSCSTETYLVAGVSSSEKIVRNIISYMKTRFFRFLVFLIKLTQQGPSKVYSFVPVQDFEEDWTDEKLNEKYKLSQEEVAFIEKMVRPIL